jgi:hypothetical protein
LQRTAVKLISTAPSTTYPTTRDVVTMDWSCGTRRQLDHDGLDVAEVSGREHLLQHLGPRHGLAGAGCCANAALAALVKTVATGDCLEQLKVLSLICFSFVR